MHQYLCLFVDLLRTFSSGFGFIFKIEHAYYTAYAHNYRYSLTLKVNEILQVILAVWKKTKGM